MGVALLREPVAEVHDVDLAGVTVGDGAERGREPHLGVEQEREVVPELHQATRSTATAASLNIGCLDTGSQAVTVSSFAARAGRSPSTSQWP